MAGKFQEVFICHPKRTAIGSFQGSLASVPAPQLGAHAIRSVLADAKLTADSAGIDEVILGCILTAGVGQAPARQATIFSGLPVSTQVMTINKVCSSGLKAVMLAADRVELGRAHAVIAGGMESMSLAPYVIPALRTGARMGSTQALDTLIHDALWDVYKDYHMGNAAELCAKECGVSREAQDEFAIESYRRAQGAIQAGYFKDEISPVEVQLGKEKILFTDDEEPGKSKLEKIPQLKPVFQKDGTVTAANASSINDGAAAMIVCSEQFAKERNLTPLARICGQSSYSQAPEWFTTAPVAAVENLLSTTGWKTNDVDLFEINEAFSVVAIACSNKLHIDRERLNVCGGAVALGHPVGASGARILTTLVYNLKRLGLQRGVAAICNGGGEATALAVERV